MAPRIVKEINVPYTVNPDDETLGRETTIIRRDGESVAVIVPYAEYTALLAQQASQPLASDVDVRFKHERAAFQRLLPELLKQHRDEWVAIIDEQPVEFGLDFNSVILRMRARYGQRPMYVGEVREQPRIYTIASPRIRRR